MIIYISKHATSSRYYHPRYYQCPMRNWTRSIVPSLISGTGTFSRKIYRKVCLCFPCFPCFLTLNKYFQTILLQNIKNCKLVQLYTCLCFFNVKNHYVLLLVVVIQEIKYFLWITNINTSTNIWYVVGLCAWVKCSFSPAYFISTRSIYKKNKNVVCQVNNGRD